jgi:hypothetical protein
VYSGSVVSEPRRDPYRQRDQSPEKLNTGVAVDRAARAARRHWISERAFRASVLEVKEVERTWRRVLHEVERPGDGTTRREVRFHPETAREIRAEIDQPDDFDAPHVNFPGQMISDERVDADSLPAELVPGLDVGFERVVESRAQHFTTPVLSVQYRTASATGAVDVMAHDSRVLAASELGPLQARQVRIVVAAGVALALGVFSVFAYASLHPWLTGYSESALSLLLVLALSFGVILVARELTLIAEARSRSAAVGAAALAVSCLAALGVVWFSTEPSVAHAQAELMAGRDEAAELEARALIARNRDANGAAAVLDELHLHRVERQRDITEMAREATRPWSSEETRAVALALLRKRTRGAADAGYASRDRAALGRLSNPVEMPDSGTREYASALLRLLEADDCSKAGDFSCATSALIHEVPLEARGRRLEVKNQVVAELGKALARENTSRVEAADQNERGRRWLAALKLSKLYRALTGAEPTPSVDQLERGYQGKRWLISLDVESNESYQERMAALREQGERQRQELIERVKKDLAEQARSGP